MATEATAIVTCVARTGGETVAVAPCGYGADGAAFEPSVVYAYLPSQDLLSRLEAAAGPIDWSAVSANWWALFGMVLGTWCLAYQIAVVLRLVRD